MESVCKDGEVVLVIEEEKPLLFLCRICHEEEGSLESPCACSGTLRFAHRGCIQRWCDEKGSTVCEICLQKYEPGYRISPKKALVDIGVTIRESLEAIGEAHDHSSSDRDDDGDDDDASDRAADCSPRTGGGASFCQSAVIAFSMGLLLRHFIAVFVLSAEYCTSTLLTVFLLRAVGILVPAFAILKGISAIQKMQEHNRRRRLLEAMDEPMETSREEQLQMQSIGSQ